MAKPTQGTALAGGCACGAVRYALGALPLVVHACHCRGCQRLGGSAFLLNLWIEQELVEVTQGTPAPFRLKGGSGRRHDVVACTTCATQLWSRYQVVPRALFVRAGTLDDPHAVTPDVHIFTRSKAPWLALPTGTPAFRTFYKLDAVWSRESLSRWRRRRT